MSAKPLPAYQETWGFTDETHEAVLREIERKKNYDIDLVELDRTYRGLALEHYEGPKVDPETYMSALSRLDNRTWHDRGVHALVQFHEATFEESEFDMMVVEQDYLYTLQNTVYPDDEITKNMVEKEHVEVPKSDMDFARISFRPDEVFIEAWEVKGSAEALDQSEQLETHDNTASQVSDNSDLNVRVSGKRMSADDVKTRMEETEDDYAIPRKYWGSTAISLGSQEVIESERFETLQEEFFRGEIDVEEALEQVETQEEFLNI